MDADGECAFCGRADVAVRKVLCDDCHAQHQVCARCAAEASADPDTFCHLLA